jgi:hypothetical protein
MPAGRPKGIPKTGGRVKIPTNKKRTLYMTDEQFEIVKIIKSLSEEEYKKLNEFIKVIRKGEKTMKNLVELYAEWRKVSEEMLADGMDGSVDCGEQRVREDFSSFAELDPEISFDVMHKLEKEYVK